MVALLFLAGAVGSVIGERGDSPPARSSVAVGFLYDMIAHHEQALQMANIELGAGEASAVKPFAQEILLFQSYEIGLMQAKLDGWGYERSDRPSSAMAWMSGDPTSVAAMPGMASEEELTLLADATGERTDALFVPLMQDHHRGALHMAAYAAKHAEDAWVRALAARMLRNQQTEIKELEGARQRAGLEKNPSGYVPMATVEDQGNGS